MLRLDSLSGDYSEEVIDVVEDFYLDLKDLIALHGRDEIERLLYQEAPSLFSPSSLSERKGGNKDPSKLKEFLKELLKGLGIGATVGGGKRAADALMGPEPVTIAGQTGEPLRVFVEPESLAGLQGLIKNTNILIQSLIDASNSAQSELDTSVDYLAAAVTGDTLANIQGAQATSGGVVEPRMERPDPRPKVRDEPEKKTKRSKKDK